MHQFIESLSYYGVIQLLSYLVKAVESKNMHKENKRVVAKTRQNYIQH